MRGGRPRYSNIVLILGAAFLSGITAHGTISYFKNKTKGEVKLEQFSGFFEKTVYVYKPNLEDPQGIQEVVYFRNDHELERIIQDPPQIKFNETYRSGELADRVDVIDGKMNTTTVPLRKVSKTIWFSAGNLIPTNAPLAENEEPAPSTNYQAISMPK